MSGGSYNYLCYQDAPEPCELRRMAERLRELGYEEWAAQTEAMIAPEPSKQLRDVWHAVEWLDSCDYGPDSFAKAMALAGVVEGTHE